MTERYTFDDANNSIVFNQPQMPASWINYLSNGTMHAFISQAAGGFAWYRSACDFRLTRYRQLQFPVDSPGFYLYVCDGGNKAWSPGWRPMETELDSWNSRHFPGRTRFDASKDDLAASAEFWVAPDYNAVVWEVELTNNSSAPKSVDLFGYVEYSQTIWSVESTWGYYLRHMTKGDFRDDTKAVHFYYHNTGPRPPEVVPVKMLAGTHPVASWSADRDEFCGEYRDERNPLAVEKRNAGNKSLACGEGCGALHNKIELAPGQSEKVCFFLYARTEILTNYEETFAKSAEELNILRDPAKLAEQKAKLTDWWSDHLDVFQCEVPEVTAERQINIWTPVNTVHTGRYSRSVNQWAPGIRGVGFRDTCQDMLSVAYRKPDWALETFRYLLTQQFEDGRTVHTSFPVEQAGADARPHSDDHLWLHLLAHAIASEKGSVDFLKNESEPWLAEDSKSATGEGSLWEHLVQGIRYTESKLGAHDIPLTLHADWNDIIGKFSKEGRGESVFAGMQYLVSLQRMMELAEKLGDTETLAFVRDCDARQRAALLKCAWNEEGWWRRGFDDDGVPVGAADSKFGQLFLNPQSWAVLANLGSREQQISAMDQVEERLMTELGLILCTPGFKTWPEEQDPFSAYGPGTGENGAIFCHANTWAIIAEAMLGRSKKAWDYYLQLVPENIIAKRGVEVYQSEAYAWVSNLIGPENERFGWGNVNQVTGTATWMDVATTQYLLGVKAEMDAVRIDPRIPSDWKGFTVGRTVDGCRLKIKVNNEAGVEHGVKSITVDGQALEGSTIPRANLKAGDTLDVSVELG